MLVILALVLSACADGGGGTAPEQPAGGGDTASGTAPPDAGLEGEPILIGAIAPITGANSLVGQYIVNGTTLAVEEINATGGILGRPVEIVWGDEVDSLQTSVNAATMLLANDNLTAIVGSLYSQFAIAAMPQVLETEIPFFVSGSSSGVSNEGNPWVWQVRPIDTFQGLALADFAVNTLGVQNPAIMHSTISTFASLADQVVDAFEGQGVTITNSNMFGFPEEETNYAPYFAQILDGDFDAIIALANQMPAALIMQQAEISGVDPNAIHTIGSTSFGSNVAITNAGPASNYWYSIVDWVPGGTTEAGARFEAAYQARFGEPSDLPSVTFYDALMLIREAAEIAGSLERAAINEALREIRSFPGAISTFSYFPDQVFATSLGITRNMNEEITMIGSVQFREP